MKVTSLAIPDVILIEPRVFEDERGFFFESFNHKIFEEITQREVTFVQDNHSKSVCSVLRGLHYQLSPMAQGKLVRVIQGEVFDVAVDVRKDSPTFGQWVSAILSGENKQQLWIPEGFAHGFQTLTDDVTLLYCHSEFYHPESEDGLNPRDPQLAIKWPLEITEISNRDHGHAMITQNFGGLIV